jgi:negative regulator of replication initiation
MSRIIRIDDEVAAHIEAHGKFGESHNDVLRRLLDIPPQENPVSATHGNRYKWHGHSAVSVIRRLAQEDWTAADVRKVFDTYGELKQVSDITISRQLKDDGTPAPLTAGQLKELTARK